MADSKDKHKLKLEVEEVLLCIMLVIMTIACSMQVIWRYVLQQSLSWSEELARYIFVWMVWLGASYATKKMRHLRITFLKEMMPVKYNIVFDTISVVITLIFSCIFGVSAVQLTQKIAYTGQMSPAMHLPMWIPYSAVPFGIILIGIRCIQVLMGFYKNNFKAKLSNKSITKSEEEAQI